MANDDELQRLRGVGGDRQPVLVDRVRIAGPDATAVLARASSLLTVVLSQDQWPGEQEWRHLLPTWFIAACAPEQTLKESEQWLVTWRGLTREEQIRVAGDQLWTLSAWLHWFDPDRDGPNRGWRWWASGVDASGSGWVDVEIPGDPYPSGSLRWLLRASGAAVIS